MSKRESALACKFFDGLSVLLLLTACERENRYVAAPPPKVTVAHPTEQTVTPYLEATGNSAAINTVKLVARVQGFLQEIKYRDGDRVKSGTPLFVIEPEPYRLKLDQAVGATAAAQAEFKQAEAEYGRQAELQTKQVSTAANLDKALAKRDSDRADLQQAQANQDQAKINYGYTQVLAPFDGVVTQRLVSIGELVGNDAATALATIVQLDPLYVNFNISERDVLNIRADLARRGIKPSDLVGKVTVEVGLQTEEGYPHKGVLDYAAPSIDPSTGTLMVRGLIQNADGALLPGYFVRVRVPLAPRPALLVPETAVGSDQGGRYILTLNADNVVEQRRVRLGQTFGEMQVVESGLKPEDRVVVSGILQAVPGQKVEPELKDSPGALVGQSAAE